MRTMRTVVLAGTTSIRKFEMLRFQVFDSMMFGVSDHFMLKPPRLLAARAPLKSQRDEFYSPPYVQQRLKMPNAFMPMYVDPRMDITDAITQMLNRRVAGGYSGGNSGN